MRNYKEKVQLALQQVAERDDYPLPPTPNSPCIFLGKKVEGSPCGSPLFTCTKFNEVTSRFIKCDKATRHCATCKVPDAEKFPVRLPVIPQSYGPYQYGAINKVHLAYHVLPVSGNGVWRRGIDQLRSRWHLFTGRKVISVATNGAIRERIEKAEGVDRNVKVLPLESLKVVANYLPKDCEVIEVKNNPRAWELESWPHLWEKITRQANNSDIVFYAHSKGATRKIDSPCQIWAEILYRSCLDHWGLVKKVLNTHPVAGSLIRIGRYFPSPNHESKWHYAGNFWWARIGPLRSKLPSTYSLSTPHGAEAWIGMAYSAEEAGRLFCTPFDPGFLYSPNSVRNLLKEYDEWLSKNPPDTYSKRLLVINQPDLLSQENNVGQGLDAG